jgi:hypothetical protein
MIKTYHALLIMYILKYARAAAKRSQGALINKKSKKLLRLLKNASLFLGKIS